MRDVYNKHFYVHLLTKINWVSGILALSSSSVSMVQCLYIQRAYFDADWLSQIFLIGICGVVYYDWHSHSLRVVMHQSKWLALDPFRISFSYTTPTPFHLCYFNKYLVDLGQITGRTGIAFMVQKYSRLPRLPLLFFYFLAIHLLTFYSVLSSIEMLLYALFYEF